MVSAKVAKKKKKYRITNWAEYNASLKKRGSLTVWIEDGFEKTWYEEPKTQNKRGRPLVYSDKCIKLMLTIRYLFKLALRQVEGYIRSLFGLLKISLIVPEFSRLSCRMKKSLAQLRFSPLTEKTYLVIDSSGIKVYGEREWLETKHDLSYQRKIWGKIHIGIDGKGLIHASKMTNHSTNDRSCFKDLIEEAGPELVDETFEDSGYDGHDIYAYHKEKYIIPIIPPPKNAKICLNKEGSTQRNKTIEYINQKGIYAWKTKNKYGRRNRVENTFFRIKTIFGRKFSSRKWDNQERESKLICHLLNEMTLLGMPKTVKI